MDINGILIVDKPDGWTSHDVVAKLRGALRIKRIGHGGTLDPMATGVLPVFIGRATRASEFCENAEKEYIAGLRLGLVTDTQDTTGKILSQSIPSVSGAELCAIIKKFLGAQKQIPPMYSAIKHNGKKLYELARRGIDVPRQERDIFISAIDLIEESIHGIEFKLRIVCSKGTYVRTLCNDIGAMLGCGAAMSSLRRTRAGSFTIEKSNTLDDILAIIDKGDINKHLLTVDSFFSEHPIVMLDDDEARRLRNGIPCSAAGLGDGRYRVFGPDNEFLLLGDVFGSEFKAIKRFYTN